MDVSFLNDGGERLLSHPPWLEEARKVRALAQLGDAQFDRAGAGLPIPVAIAIALGEPVGGSLAKASAGPRANLQLHQPLGGEGDHLAQDIRVGGLPHQRAEVHHLIGHRGSSIAFVSRNPNLPENRR